MLMKKKIFLDLKKKNDYCKIFFPKKKTSFTILRSPHVHKKARDQYHIKTNKGLFLFSFPKEKQEESFLFLKYLTQISFIGVQIHIKMNNVTYLPHLGA
jgi:ribosomal protein S10